MLVQVTKGIPRTPFLDRFLLRIDAFRKGQEGLSDVLDGFAACPP